MKTSILMIALISALSITASAMPQDFAFSIYGEQAQHYFQALPKISDDAAYAENKSGPNGNTIDSLKIVIEGQQINSILCHQIGEQTFACEARTDWFSNPK
jgi:hypothetical protein